MRWDERPLLIGLSLLLAATCAPAAAEETAGSAIDIRVADGSLMVDVRDAPLADVLRTIGDRAHVDVTVSGRLDSRVTRSFVSPSVEDAVRRLTRGHSTVWTYAPSPTTPDAPQLTRLVVIASAAPASVERITIQERNARRQTIHELARRPDQAATAELVRFLRDPDSSIRMEALASLAQRGGADAEEATRGIVDVLRTDADPRVRVEAARLLARRASDAARRALEAAASDTDLTVRRAAATALESSRMRSR